MCCSLPSDLRFAPLEFLDVSGNKLKGEVPPMLCNAGDINGNGRNGVFQCDVIACPIGTYSASGFAEGIEKLAYRVCRSCPSNSYLASRGCEERFSLSAVMDGRTTAGSSNGLLLVLITIISALCMSFVCQPVLSANEKEEQQQEKNDDVHNRDELGETIGSVQAVAETRNHLYPLVKSITSRFGNEDDHPLAFIDIPSKGSVGPASAPLCFTKQSESEKELEDEWLSYT